MYIDKLSLNNFRNYESQQLSLGKNINIFFGMNAAGKTNLLEALYVFGVGRSPRATKDSELVRWDSPAAHIKASVVKQYSSRDMEIYIEKNKKRIAIDGIPVKRLGEIMGVINIVFFSPDELRFVKDSPVLRRRFLDISLSQQNKIYYYNLARYNNILASRNKLLKSSANIIDTLPIWEIQLAECGAKIIELRKEYINGLKSLAKCAHAKLTNDKEQLIIEYETECNSTDTKDIEKELLALFKKNRSRDLRLQFTGNGPHRDDIKLIVDEIDIKKYGSQGQQRTVALSLKLAELELFKVNTGEYPILLLDDVLSELDKSRRSMLIEAIKDVQTIITCTSIDDALPPSAKLFFVENGKVSEQ